MNSDLIYNEISEVLSQIRSSKSDDNLLGLLSKMMDTKIALDDDRKYTDFFEDISLRIKTEGHYLDDERRREVLMKALEDFAGNVKPEKELLAAPVNTPEDPEGEVTPITSINYVPDYHALFKKISWAGVGMSEKESYLLSNSLRNLAAKLQAGLITFFGKIFGTEKDYYIAQISELEPQGEPNYDPDQEHRKEDGVNFFTYYVTNDLTQEWVELPDIKPRQIIVARQIRYAFTGNLKRKIYSNPHFDGLEEHLLRCQISRIYHGTKLVPSLNHYTVEDAENPFRPFVVNEKPKQLKHKDLIDLKNWIHYPPGILKQGRVSHFLEPPEDADPEEYKKKELEKDPYDQRIKPASEDNAIDASTDVVELMISPWKLTQHGEDVIYTNPYIKLLDEKADGFDPLDQKDNLADYSLICVKSLLWPGAFNFYLEKESYHFYFGDGMKFTDTVKERPFNFRDFPVVPEDEGDLEDGPEPTIPPKEPGEEEEEGKEGEEGKEEGGEE